MSLVRKSRDISTNAPSYKNYVDLLNPHGFSHLQGEIKKMECVKVLEVKEKSLVVTKEKCSCVFDAQLGLP